MSILRIDYKFPKPALMDYFLECYPSMKDYVVPSDMDCFDTDIVEGFKVDEDRHFDSFLCEIAQQFCDCYNIKDKFVTQYLVVEPNKILPWHEDGNPASCAVNCLLTGDNAPIEFKDGEYTYDTALLNIRKEHRVSNGPNIRVMFRIVFYGEESSYNEIERLIDEAA